MHGHGQGEGHRFAQGHCIDGEEGGLDIVRHAFPCHRRTIRKADNLGERDVAMETGM